MGEIFLGILVVCAVVLVLSWLGDRAMNAGWFWLFLLLTILGGGLFAAALQIATSTVEDRYGP